MENENNAQNGWSQKRTSENGTSQTLYISVNCSRLCLCVFSNQYYCTFCTEIDTEQQIKSSGCINSTFEPPLGKTEAPLSADGSRRARPEGPARGPSLRSPARSKAEEDLPLEGAGVRPGSLHADFPVPRH